MKITKTLFGKLPGGEIVNAFTLDNGIIAVTILNFGGIITSLKVPDKTGKQIDVVLGFDKFEKYVNKHPYFGSIIGRFAGRINAGRFKFDDKTYTLAKKKGEALHIHGGIKGFDKFIWKATELKEPDFVGLCLSRLSPDGEEGFPGNLDVIITYKLTRNNELILDYSAATDKATPVSLTNHTYFNLNGENSEKDVLNTILIIDADKYLPLDDNSIPTGILDDVDNTPMDFRKPEEIGKKIKDNFAQIRRTNGYDHPWILNKKKTAQPNITAYNPENGINLEVTTDQPCVVIYTSNGMDNSIKGKKDFAYKIYYGFCLETQGLPDAVNHPNFPSVIVTPDKPYKQLTVWKFSIK